jgi:hypothetical protein
MLLKKRKVATLNGKYQKKGGKYMENIFELEIIEEFAEESTELDSAGVSRASAFTDVNIC